MGGSIYGRLFRVSTWGESHGPAVGVTVDGCPAGLVLTTEMIQKDLDRRRPGQSRFTTARQEADEVEILSGVFEGKTTGTPISMIVRNKDQRSRDYGNLAVLYRPGHADLGFDSKYGFRDYRGGGRSSARETIARVAAGAVARAVLDQAGVRIGAFTSAIGPVTADENMTDYCAAQESPLRMADPKAEEEAAAYLEKCIREQDSCGGQVTCLIDGVPAGVGEPVFDKLDAALAQAMMSIGAVKAVEVGDGVSASRSRGSLNNDIYAENMDGVPVKCTNHSGGILGGISDGSRIRLRVSFKPTPSIAAEQPMLGRDGKIHRESIKGRHDPCVVPRAVAVVEAMAAVTCADLLLCNMSSRIEYVRRIYNNSEETI